MTPEMRAHVLFCGYGTCSRRVRRVFCALSTSPSHTLSVAFGMMAERQDEKTEEPFLLPDIIREETRFMATLFGYRQAMNLRFITGFREILKNFDILEIYCDAPTESCQNYDQCTVDLSIQEALQYPRRVSGMEARTPMDITNVRQFTMRDLKLMWCRLVSHYFEWLAGVPEVKQLSELDKMRLVTRQLCKVICWTVAWRTYQLGIREGLTFGCGLLWIPTHCADPTIRSYVSNLASVMQNLLVSKIRVLRLTRNEYLLVKLATLFSNTGSIALSGQGHQTCSSALNKYTAALVEEVIDSRSDLTTEQIQRRITTMLSVLPNMETVSEVDDRYLMELTMNNNGNIQGRLTNEIHVHSHI